MNPIEVAANLLAGAINLGAKIVDALKRAPRVLRPKTKPRPRVHVPTQAERQAQRDAEEHRLNRFGRH